MRILLGILVAVALAAPVGAEHCTSYTTSWPEVTYDPYYVDHDICQPDCFNAINVYEETNGIAGLQRGDEMVDDTCHGQILPDTLHWQTIY